MRAVVAAFVGLRNSGAGLPAAVSPSRTNRMARTRVSCLDSAALRAGRARPQAPAPARGRAGRRPLDLAGAGAWKVTGGSYCAVLLPVVPNRPLAP